MARQAGTWVSYEPGSKTLGDSVILSPHSSEVNALRAAVEDGNKVVFVEYGDTIVEAINKAMDAAAAPTLRRASSAASQRDGAE